MAENGIMNKVLFKFDWSMIIATEEYFFLLLQATIIHGNVLEHSFHDATAIFVYLLPEGMLQLKPALVQLIENGARVVSYGQYPI